MKRIFILLLCIYSLSLSAQTEKKIYYNKDWKVVTNKDSARFYRILKLDKNSKPVGEVRDFYITGEKQAIHDGIIKLDGLNDHNSVFSGDTKIFYASGSKASIIKRTKEGVTLTETGWYNNGNKWYWVDYKDGKREGILTYQYENGMLQASVQYSEGKREGVSKWYYSTGDLKEEANFTNDTLQGLDKKYWENGNVSSQCIFDHGKVEGKYEEYFSTGTLKNETFYVHDLKGGNAKEFYESGKIFSEANYENDSLQGQLKIYFEDGRLRQVINYMKGKREGVAKGYYANGKVESEWTYSSNKLNGNVTKYWQNGNVKEQLTYTDDKVTNRVCKDSTGTNIDCIVKDSISADNKVYTIVQQMPQAPFDMNAYLSKNIVYPAYEKSKGITGTVFVNFIVEKDGSINNVILLKGVDNGLGLEKEAVRVISSMPKWNPGKQNGKVVRVYYNIPIRFVLD